MNHASGNPSGPHPFTLLLSEGMHSWMGTWYLGEMLSSNIFHTNPLNFPKIQTIMIETYSLMPGASN